MQISCSFLDKHPEVALVACGWAALGFIRGWEFSLYKGYIFFSDRLSYGCMGTILYICPAYAPFMFLKEMKRFEFDVLGRGRYELSSDDYYNFF